MTSTSARLTLSGEQLQLLTLQAIAEHLQRLADEATEIYRAALARAEGTPLLDPLHEQEKWMRDGGN